MRPARFHLIFSKVPRNGKSQGSHAGRIRNLCYIVAVKVGVEWKQAEDKAQASVKGKGRERESGRDRVRETEGERGRERVRGSRQIVQDPVEMASGERLNLNLDSDLKRAF